MKPPALDEARRRRRCGTHAGAPASWIYERMSERNLWKKEEAFSGSSWLTSAPSGGLNDVLKRPRCGCPAAHNHGPTQVESIRLAELMVTPAELAPMSAGAKPLDERTLVLRVRGRSPSLPQGHNNPQELLHDEHDARLSRISYT